VCWWENFPNQGIVPTNNKREVSEWYEWRASQVSKIFKYFRILYNSSSIIQRSSMVVVIYIWLVGGLIDSERILRIQYWWDVTKTPLSTLRPFENILKEIFQTFLWIFLCIHNKNDYHILCFCNLDCIKMHVNHFCYQYWKHCTYLISKYYYLWYVSSSQKA
jgi:hypothetical protein